jgi:hypothetical protein
LNIQRDYQSWIGSFANDPAYIDVQMPSGS